MRLAIPPAGGPLLVVIGAIAAGACTTKEPQPSTYFERIIAPGLQGSCVRSNTGAGCHVADAKGNAFGNLDLSTFDGINRRRDLLLDYGPYLRPSLLVKNIPPFQLTIQLWDGTTVAITTDITHAGGPILDPTGTDYQTLRQWIENGATVNNTGVPPVDIPTVPCNQTVPPAQPGFDPNSDPSNPDYMDFVQSANGVLTTSCAFGNCHGTTVNALYLTCGLNPQQLRWNFFAAENYLAATPEESELVRRPLASAQGGSYHEGGPIFSSVTDPKYTALVSWAKAHGAPQPPQSLGATFLFFAQKVQPILAKKGCMMEQCHSAGMFHDYRLRGGSAGSFSLTTTQRNYTFSVAQMSFESDDVDASRLVQKNLFRPDVVAGSTGIIHRGGPLFEDFGTGQNQAGMPVVADRAALCDQANYDFDNAPVDTIPAYCVVREWHRRERVARNLAGLSAIVYVSRPIPSGSDRPQDFDVFAGGASLHIVAASLTPGGGVTLGTDTAVDLTTCGLSSGADVRRPAVSWDAATIAFAARSTANDPLAIYTINPDGTGCTLQPDIANHPPSGMSLPNGDMLLEHDFDPSFSPPDPNDNVERIVFASTRGNSGSNLDSAAFDYSGPQRTPSDPTKPNANLYVLEPDPSGSGAMTVRQLTWQLNMERYPSFMQDGRLIFTAEKREPGFYQLALRRQNLDGGDYHPLFAQRGTIGATQAAYAVELADKNFAAIFSETSAQHGAGALAVFNRSVGVDFTSANPADYIVDKTVIDPASSSSPEADFFLHSLSPPFTDGSYTSPSPLPDGTMLVSFGSGDPATFGGDYDLYVLDPLTGQKTLLTGASGTAEVEAVAVYPRVAKGIFVSTPDEPNGHTTVQSGQATADITVLDMPVLASLLFQNTPTGRVVEPDLKSFDVFEELPPNVSSFPAACGNNVACDGLGPTGMVYVRRRVIGTVPLQGDGSAHFAIPGGLPILMHLPDDTESAQLNLPRWQRETMTFVPGEVAHQSFPQPFFDHLCAGCHGSISGLPVDAALQPDFLTEASQVEAVGTQPVDCSGPPSSRGTIQGAPASP